MGYESLERESMQTHRFALKIALTRLKSIGEHDRQKFSDINYELKRIDEELMKC